MHNKPNSTNCKILSVVFCALLSACGGGGGDNTSSQGIAPAATPAAAAPGPNAVPTPAPTPTPAPSAQTYFYFSSGYDALTVLGTAQSKAALAKYTNVIAGIDAGGATASSDFLSRAQKLRAQGWRLHVYLEGPGGPTGSSWGADECLRVQAAAKTYGTNPVPAGDTCGNDNAAWMKEWNDTGFFKQLQQQLKDLQPLGVESVEVDNLYRAGYADSLKPLSEFITRFNNGKAATNPIKLLLKNIGSPGELDALLAASPRAAIADYMILEEDFKSQWCALQSSGKKYGITAAFSWNTSDYHAEIGRAHV